MRIYLLLSLTFAACLAPSAFAQPPAGGDRRGPPLFLSPMGEPFRGSPGGPAPLQMWFGIADANRDGAIDLTEIQSDASRFYATLDVDRDGEIEPAEMDRYETEVAPELLRGPISRRGGFGGGERMFPPGGVGGPRGGGPPGGRRPGGRGGPGAAPGLPGAPGLLGLRQPVASADEDLNRGVTRSEFQKAAAQRLVLLDRNRDGGLQVEELAPPPRSRRKG